MKFKLCFLSLLTTCIILASSLSQAAPMPVTFDFSDATFISKNFSGYLKPKGPEIVYQFQVKEEGKMAIRFYEDATILYQEFYTSLKIKDASGKIIRETTLSGKESNSVMTAELSPGTYYYTIRTSEYGDAREYTLNFNFSPNLPYDSYVKNVLHKTFDLESATPKVLSENITQAFKLEEQKSSDANSDHLKGTNGNLALFAFEPSKSQYYRTLVSDLPEYVNGYILDEKFNVLHYADTNEFDHQSQQVFINSTYLDAGKKYYILLVNTTSTPLNGDLKISPISSASNFIDMTFNDTFGSGPLLSPNSTYADRIVPLFLIGLFVHNDRDWCRIELDEDSLVLLELQQQKREKYDYNDLRISIFDENKMQISYTDMDTTLLKQTIPLGLKKGKYFIRLEANNFFFDKYAYNIPYSISYTTKQEKDFVDFEPNDSLKSAVPLKFNQKIHAYFQTFYDKDFYKFTLSKKTDVGFFLSAYDDFEVLQDTRYNYSIYDSKGKLIETLTTGMSTIYKTDWLKQNGKLKRFSTGCQLNKGTYYVEVSPCPNSTSESVDTFQHLVSSKSDDKRYKTYWLELSEFKD